MEYTFAICDDNLNHLEILYSKIGDVSKVNSLNFKIDKYNLGIKLIEELSSNPNKYDVIFLDIEMPDMDGIKAGHRIREINKNVIIIFITGFAGFALNAFEIRAFNYLLKPINFTKLERVIKEAVIEIKLHKNINQELNTLLLLYNKKMCNINANEIIYIEKISNKSRIVCDDTTYEVCESLGKLKQKLGVGIFIQPHQGFIVNSKKIRNYKDQKLEMVSGDFIPVSKRNIKEIKKIFFESLRY